MKQARARRAEYLYPKVVEAIADPTRRRILELLAKSERGRLAFTEIKRALRVKNSSALAHHLNMLQRAWLVERTTDLASPRTAKDPYYCFYSLTRLGEQVTQRVLSCLEESLSAGLSAAA